MLNDRKITISVGASRKSVNWQGQDLNYSDFVKKLETPVRSQETLEEYLKLSKAKQDDLKDVGGFVGGALKGVRRKASNILSRDLVTLDFDNIPTGETEAVIKKVMTLGCGYVIYSTRKHAPYRPRLRIILPLDRSVTSDEYEPIARYAAKQIGIEMADPTTFEPSRLMFWPSCSNDSQYVYKYEDKPFLSADGVLATYADWRDINSWPQVPGVDVGHRKDLTKQQDPTTKTGLIGAFCRAYDIYEAMETFIPKAYDPTADQDRYTYLQGSTTGGAIIYEDGKFLYSHHATDPCGGQLVNAWDLVRLHKFSDLDEEAAEGTPVATLPSTTAMKDLARSDDKVIGLLNRERQEAAADYFDVLGQNGPDFSPDISCPDEEDDAWMANLTADAKGNYDKTIANITLILDHDPNFKDKIYLDEFANRGMVELPLPWEDGEGARMWTDTDDAQLALRLEKVYGITGEKRIETALKVVAFNHRRNEVKEYLTGLNWDGQERIKTLLQDYLGAEESVYASEIMRKALIAAISRALSSKGVKFDYMVVFSGPQGIGKSTFLAKLGRDWFSDSLYSFEGKEAAELIQGTLINEVGELSAMTKSETEIVKQFLSKTHDIYREAYGRRTRKFARRCVFFGSTNSESFLKDATGSRRFWPIRVGDLRPTKDIFEDLDGEVDQIWAEAYNYYILGEKLVLSQEAQEIAESMQYDYRDVDPKEGIILEFLKHKIPKNWYDMEPRDQRAFMAGTFKASDDLELVDREKVCIAEVWQVCFGGDVKYLNRRDSNELVNIMTGLPGWTRNKNPRSYGKYGKQKGFERTNIINIDNQKRKHGNQ
ncbi:virulence-associated protein E [Peptoniphilus sp. oral taxon 375 str. F0436]|nr:virulence-associated protein E [Peptoniphilus sp. oral taxon 375 str. F0436]